jgi:uncharacterized membrane protein
MDQISNKKRKSHSNQSTIMEKSRFFIKVIDGVLDRAFGCLKKFDINRHFPMIFVLIAVSAGLGLASITPIDQVNDEAAHIARTAALTRGVLFGSIRTLKPIAGGPDYRYSGVRINEGLAKASVAEIARIPNIFVIPIPHMSKPAFRTAQALKWSHKLIFVHCPNTLQFFPALYWPGALGIGVGHSIGLTPLQSLTFGRLLMLLSYVTIGALALKIAKFGQPIMFTILVLPLSLNLAASYNQDGQIIAACILASALLTGPGSTRRWLAGLILALVMCSKPPYALLLGVMMLPLRAPGLLKRIGQTILLGLPSVLWVICFMAIDHTKFHTTFPYMPGRWWPGPWRQLHYFQDDHRNLQVLLIHPIRFVVMPVKLMLSNGLNFLSQSIGLLGQNSITLGKWYFFCWFFAIIFAWISVFTTPTKNNDTKKVSSLDRVFLIFLIISSCFAMILSIYLSWAELGQTTAVGVTGRYFLLFPPFLLLCFLPLEKKSIFSKIRDPFRSDIFYTMFSIPSVSMGVYGAIYLPAWLARRYYLGS